MRAVGGLFVGSTPGRGLVRELGGRLGESVAKEEFTFHFLQVMKAHGIGKGKDPGGCRGPTLAGPGVGTGGVQRRGKQLGRPVAQWM